VIQYKFQKEKYSTFCFCKFRRYGTRQYLTYIEN